MTNGNAIKAGAAVREARRRAGLTALESGTRSGIDEMRIYAIERNRARINIVDAAALGAALGVDPKTLAPELFEGGKQ